MHHRQGESESHVQRRLMARVMHRWMWGFARAIMALNLHDATNVS